MEEVESGWTMWSAVALSHLSMSANIEGLEPTIVDIMKMQELSVTVSSVYLSFAGMTSQLYLCVCLPLLVFLLFGAYVFECIYLCGHSHLSADRQYYTVGCILFRFC